MEIKVYLPQTVHVPSEYILALAQRTLTSLGDGGEDVSATRGHLVRQAVSDGLLRELDELIREDGTIDLFCDPASEIPLELKNKSVTLGQLCEALKAQDAFPAVNENNGAAKKTAPRQEAAVQLHRHAA